MSESVESPRSEISLLAISIFFWQHIVIIGPCIAACAIAAAVLAFTLTPLYRSGVVFSPSTNSGNVGSFLSGQLGGLAALTDINVRAVGQRTEASLEYLRSQRATRHLLERHSRRHVRFAR